MTHYAAFIIRNPLLLGFGFLTVFWGNFGQSFFIAWFGAEIQSSLGLSASSYGAAYSLATLGAAFTVVWLGGLIDRVSLRPYVLAVAAGMAIACLLMARATNLIGLFLAFYLLRLFGQSLLPHTGVTSMGRYFTDARGKAISVAMTGVPVGEVVLPLLAVAMIAWSGWQSVYLLVAAMTVLMLMPGLWLLSGRIQARVTAASAVNETEIPSTAPRAAGRRQVLADRRYWLALPALMANPFLITGIFIHQNFLVSSKAWSISWLASCFVIYGIVHWLSSLASGSLVDRFGATRVLPFLLLPLLLALSLIAWLPGWWVAVPVMSLLGMSSGGSPPITGSLWAEMYGTANLGAIRAMNMAIMVFATAISPVLFGYVIDMGVGHEWLFGSSAVYVATAMVLLWFSYPRTAGT